MREKLLQIVPEGEFTKEQRKWLMQPHETSRPLFEREYNDYSCLKIHSDILPLDLEVLVTALHWLSYYREDDYWNEDQLQALVEIILNRNLLPDEKQYIADATVLWNFTDDVVQDIVRSVIFEYVHVQSEPEYECLIPAQLALFFITGTEESKREFWDELRLETADMIKLADIVKKHIV